MTRPTRRRRKDNLGGHKQRLGATGLDLDRRAFQYRWVNEDRFLDRTVEDDYDPVKKPGRPAEGEDNTIRRHVGKKADGSPEYGVLCRKPRDLYAEDRKAHDNAIDETMTTIRRGQAGVTRDAEHTYTPSEGIKISDG